MKQQSTVRWLQEALEHTILTKEQIMQTIGLFEQANNMDKERIIDAVNFGDERGKITTYLTAEQYYKDKYELYNEKDESNQENNLFL